MNKHHLQVSRSVASTQAARTFTSPAFVSCVLGSALATLACTPKTPATPPEQVVVETPQPVATPPTVEEPPAPPPLSLRQVAHRDATLGFLDVGNTLVVAGGVQLAYPDTTGHLSVDKRTVGELPSSDAYYYGGEETTTLVSFSSTTAKTQEMRPSMIVQMSEMERSGPTYSVQARVGDKWKVVPNEKDGLTWFPIAAAAVPGGSIALVNWSVSADGEYMDEEGSNRRKWRRIEAKLRKSKSELRWFGEGPAPALPVLPDLRKQFAEDPNDISPWDQVGLAQKIAALDDGTLVISVLGNVRDLVYIAPPGATSFSALPELPTPPQRTEISEFVVNGNDLYAIGALSPAELDPGVKLSEEEKKARRDQAFVYRLTPQRTWEEVSVPRGDREMLELALDFAVEADGTQWLITARRNDAWGVAEGLLWRRAPGGEWGEVELPQISLPELGNERWLRDSTASWELRDALPDPRSSDTVYAQRLGASHGHVFILARDFNAPPSTTGDLWGVFTPGVDDGKSETFALPMMLEVERWSKRTFEVLKPKPKDCPEIVLELAQGDSIAPETVAMIKNTLGDQAERDMYRVSFNGHRAVAFLAEAWEPDTWLLASRRLQEASGQPFPAYCGVASVHGKIEESAPAE